MPFPLTPTALRSRRQARLELSLAAIEAKLAWASPDNTAWRTRLEAQRWSVQEKLARISLKQASTVSTAPTEEELSHG